MALQLKFCAKITKGTYIHEKNNMSSSKKHRYILSIYTGNLHSEIGKQKQVLKQVKIVYFLYLIELYKSHANTT